MNRLLVARYAMVLWPPPEQGIGCITLDALPAAIRRGAMVIGREDAILEEPVGAFDVAQIRRAQGDGDDGA